MGGAVNLASRLEGAAPASSILISEETFLQVQQHFDFKEATELELKGVGRKVKSYEVVIDDYEVRKILNFSGDSYDLTVRKDQLGEKDIDALKKIISEL